MSRSLLVAFILTVCTGSILTIFWQQEVKFTLPTPIPANFNKVDTGSHVALSSISGMKGALFLHFYNPDCPCSRFNGRHLNRYCTSRATHFAELSLIALHTHQPPPLIGILTTQSYGCELSLLN